MTLQKYPSHLSEGQMEHLHDFLKVLIEPDVSSECACAEKPPAMSEGHIQLTSQLEKSHKKRGVVLIWRVGTLRTAAAKQPARPSPHGWPIRSQRGSSHVGQNAGLMGLVIGRRQDERKSRGTIVEKGAARWVKS